MLIDALHNLLNRIRKKKGNQGPMEERSPREERTEAIYLRAEEHYLCK